MKIHDGIKIFKQAFYLKPLANIPGLIRMLPFIFALTGFGSGIFPQEEKSIKESPGMNLENIVADIRLIWPSGKCADNISGDKGFALIAFACKADFTADNRRSFLDKMLARGWQLRREDYHIDKNSATYFYRFQVDLDHDVYFKLFFRDPVVIWPLHENVRPKIIVFLNDVQSPEEIQKWVDLKLPLTLSVSMLSEQRDKIIEMAKKSSYDTWLFLPDQLRLEYPNKEHIEQNMDQRKNESEKEIIAARITGQKVEQKAEGQNPTQNSNEKAVVEPAPNLQTLTEVLRKYPDQQFPFSGLSISAVNQYTKNIEHLRALFLLMKQEGVKKFVGPSTTEIVDTAKVLDLDFAGQTFYLGLEETINETAWHDAYENSKANGYSVLILDVRNMEARNFLLKMIQETVSFVDYTTLEHVH